jgi:hypothetical protein
MMMSLLYSSSLKGLETSVFLAGGRDGSVVATRGILHQQCGGKKEQFDFWVLAKVVLLFSRQHVPRGTFAPDGWILPSGQNVPRGTSAPSGGPCPKWHARDRITLPAGKRSRITEDATWKSDAWDAV